MKKVQCKDCKYITKEEANEDYLSDEIILICCYHSPHKVYPLDSCINGALDGTEEYVMKKKDMETMERVILCKDGDTWFAAFGNFVNLQESIVFFHKNPVKALKKILRYQKNNRKRAIKIESVQECIL